MRLPRSQRAQRQRVLSSPRTLGSPRTLTPPHRALTPSTPSTPSMLTPSTPSMLTPSTPSMLGRTSSSPSVSVLFLFVLSRSLTLLTFLCYMSVLFTLHSCLVIYVLSRGLVLSMCHS